VTQGSGCNIFMCMCCVHVYLLDIVELNPDSMTLLQLPMQSQSMTWLCVSDLQVQVHPSRIGHMFGLGDTVFLGCQASGCAASGRSLALYRCVVLVSFRSTSTSCFLFPPQYCYFLLSLYMCVYMCVCVCHMWLYLRNGLNLGSYEKWMVINRFEQHHAGTYTCRPIPPQNVQSPPLSVALGRKWSIIPSLGFLNFLFYT